MYIPDRNSYLQMRQKTLPFSTLNNIRLNNRYSQLQAELLGNKGC